MTYHLTLSDDYLWCLILLGKQTAKKIQPNTKLQPNTNKKIVTFMFDSKCSLNLNNKYELHSIVL